MFFTHHTGANRPPSMFFFKLPYLVKPPMLRRIWRMQGLVRNLDPVSGLMSEWFFDSLNFWELTLNRSGVFVDGSACHMALHLMLLWHDFLNHDLWYPPIKWGHAWLVARLEHNKASWHQRSDCKSITKCKAEGPWGSRLLVKVIQLVS